MTSGWRSIAFVATFLCVLGQSETEAVVTFRFYPGVNTAYRDPSIYGSGVALPVNSTMLVYVSPDTTRSFESTWLDGTDGGDYGSGADIMLFATNTFTAGTYRHFPSYNALDSLTTSNAYLVVFDYPFADYLANGNTIPDGTGYALLSSTYALPAPGTPAVFAPTEVLYTSSHLSVVPEPTTLALIATGMGVVLVRRRRKTSAESEEAA